MLIPLYATLSAALLFYLIVPIFGAVSVARSWRVFRRRVAELGRQPPLGYGDLRRADSPGDRAISSDRQAERPGLGSFRLYGKIEAMEEERRIWVRGEQVSALVDMSESPLYVLLPGKPLPGSVRRYAWKSISTLAAGTGVFVGGKVRMERGTPCFVDDPEERLIVATYDGGDANVIRGLIVGGRNPNEYWTALGPVSVAIGMTLSSGLLLLLGSRTAFSTIRALSFLTAMIPVLPLLPPGLGLFLLYRRLWRRALRFRTERDLFRYLSASVDSAVHAGSAQRKAAIVGLAALALCILAVAVNYILAFLLWRSVF
ncbi:MAG: hypothetical protein M0Z80_11855 [Treponema sp.]|nr:hypothetical protein [Treponema sp.]